MCYGRELSCHQHLVLQSLFVLLSYVLYVIFLRAERSLALLVIMHNMHVSNVLKHFPLKFGEKADFTGTDRTLWPPRNIETHRK